MPLKHSKSDKKSLLLEVSLKLFAQYSFESTSVRMIASEAGVSLGLMYNYFKDKDHLLSSIFEHYRQVMDQTFSVDNPEALPNKQLEELVDNAFNSVNEHLLLWRLLYGLRMQPSSLKLITHHIIRITGIVQHNLERIFAAMGYTSPETEARLFFASLDGIFTHYILYHRQYPMEEVRDSLLSKYLQSKS